MTKTVGSELVGALKRSWWVLLLRGILAIVFAVLTFMQPGISLASLVLFFGAYSLVDGVMTVWIAIAGSKDNDSWWVLVLRGILGILIGVVTFYMPGLTGIALLFYIAIWAIATGVLEMVIGLHLRKWITGEWLLILCGLVSVGFGVLMMFYPGAGALAVISLIAGFALVYGVLLVLLAVKSRKFVSRL